MQHVNLINGIQLVYNADTQGHVIIEFPDGLQVRTTWGQLSRIETLIDCLRQAYESLLMRAGSDGNAPVDTLMRIDDLLFSLDRSSRTSNIKDVN